MQNLLALVFVSTVALAWTRAVLAEDVQDLVGQLKSPTADVRRDAAQALGKLGTEAKAAVPALIASLKDENMFVRRYSAQSLGKIGPAAKSAVPALTKSLEDMRKEVAEAATEALGKLGPDSVPALVHALKNKGNDGSIRRKAA